MKPEEAKDIFFSEEAKKEMGEKVDIKLEMQKSNY